MLAALFVLSLAHGVEPAEVPRQPERLTAEAATSAGLTTFAGLVLGALGTPAAVGLGFVAAGSPLSLDGLLVAAVAGGSLGAASGAALGALPTTTWEGVPLAAGAAAVGALAGLLPAALIGRETLSGAAGDDPVADTLFSGAIFGAMLAASTSAAAVATLFAAERPHLDER